MSILIYVLVQYTYNIWSKAVFVYFCTDPDMYDKDVVILSYVTFCKAAITTMSIHSNNYPAIQHNMWTLEKWMVIELAAETIIPSSFFGPDVMWRQRYTFVQMCVTTNEMFKLALCNFGLDSSQVTIKIFSTIIYTIYKTR